MKNTSLTAMAIGLAFSACAVTAQAMTFAEYGSTSSAANLQWTQSADLASGALTTTGVGASTDTVFSFLTPALSALSNLSALFTLTATAPASDPAVTGLGQIAEQNLSGSFSFTYTGAAPLTVGAHTYNTGANLLSGAFTGAEIIGPNFGSTASVQDAIFSGGTVSFTSDIVQFASTGDKGLSVALTSVLPILSATSGNALNSFTGVSTGNFASDIASGGGGGGVPEPVTWAMMLLGFGGIGTAIRVKRGKSASALV